MDKKYRVVFVGLVTNEDNFIHGISRLGVASDSAELIISKAPVILKEDMRLKEARRYADAVQQAGGRVLIKAHGFFKDEDVASDTSTIEPMENFIMCPQCGHKQLKGGTCVRCGLTFKESG
jgi:hypothetical protein